MFGFLFTIGAVLISLKALGYFVIPWWVACMPFIVSPFLMAALFFVTDHVEPTPPKVEEPKPKRTITL